MTFRLLLASVVAAGSSCLCTVDPGGKHEPVLPGVFITVDEPNAIGTQVTGKVTVSGCNEVSQLQIFESDELLTEVHFSQNPTPFALSAELLRPLFKTKGLAASLTLSAKVLCSDGRANTTVQSAGVRFFPVTARGKAADGSQLVPDQFVAEGGIGGSAVTFLGCIRTDSGTTLARVNRAGEVIAVATGMPFGCTLGTQISANSTVSGIRWVMEPNLGGYALNGALEVQKVFRAQKTARMAVGSSGIAVFFVDDAGLQKRLQKVDPVASTANDWNAVGAFVGMMSADPVVDEAAGAVYCIDRRFDVGTRIADTVFFKVDLRTGALLNGVVNGRPPVIFQQQFPLSTGSLPVDQDGLISADGSLYFRPVLNTDTQGKLRSTVVACSTTLGLCDGAGRVWTSPTLEGELRLVVSFAGGQGLAAVGPYHTYFLDAQTGSLLNLGGKALQPSGSQVIVGVHPGAGTDFYILTNPNLKTTTTSYATEIIGTDVPTNGELWRLQYGSGESSSTAMYIGTDDNGQMWVRAGTDLLELWSINQYRDARGPTPSP